MMEKCNDQVKVIALAKQQVQRSKLKIITIDKHIKLELKDLN